MTNLWLVPDVCEEGLKAELYQCPLHVDVARVQLIVQRCTRKKKTKMIPTLYTHFIKVKRGEWKTVIQKQNSEGEKILKKT